MAFTIGKKSLVDVSNEKKEWCDISVTAQGEEEDLAFSLLISSAYSPRVLVRQGYVTRSTNEIARQVGAGTKDFSLSEHAVDAILKSNEESLRTLAEEVVHDWKDVNGADGNPIAYDPKVMVQILKEWPVIRAAIEENAERIGLGIEKQEEETKEK